MDVYVGELRLFPWNFAPKGWALCDGSLLNIQQYAALYSLLGTHFGGNGTTTFGLPDLRGRTAINTGQIPNVTSMYTIGNSGGVENVTLTAAQAPTHNHLFMAEQVVGTVGSNVTPDPMVAQPVNINMFNPNTPVVNLMSGSMDNAGGGQAHNNMQPYLVLNYCIALVGIYPPRP